MNFRVFHGLLCDPAPGTMFVFSVDRVRLRTCGSVGLELRATSLDRGRIRLFLHRLG